MERLKLESTSLDSIACGWSLEPEGRGLWDAGSKSPGLGSLSNSVTFLQVTAHLAAYLSPSVSFLSSTCKAEKDSLTIYYLTQDPQLHSRGPQHKWRKLYKHSCGHE